jgi:hypothetical protein
LNDLTKVSGIYALTHPDTDRVMYVGQSVDIDFRYRQHCKYLAAAPSAEMLEWLGELRQEHKKPKIIVLEKADGALKLDEAEKKWVHIYKSRGEAELNIASGGRGGVNSYVANTPREEWFQFARKVRAARSMLSVLTSATGRMAGAKYMDPMWKLEQKLDKEMAKIEKRVLEEFPDWHDFAQALRSTKDPE